MMCALGVVYALFMCLYRAKSAHLSVLRMLILFTFSISVGFSGAIFTHFVVTLFTAGLSGYTPGFVFYGGLIFGFLGAFAAGKLFAFSLSDYAPAAVPSLPAAHALGRIGCFLAGCCYGCEWEKGVLHPDGVFRFPVQLLESACLIVISAFLVFAVKRGEKRPLRLYVLLYAPVRFLLEFLRADAVRGSFLFLSTSQWISLLLLILALIPVKKTAKG